MIDFELYRVFIEVAKEENITKASEKLNISQPAVTKQIKNLENQLSLVLFERKSKGLILTEDGKKLYEKLKNPIEELYPIDSEIDVYYNPENPKLSYVLRYCNKKWTFWLTFFSGVLVLVIDIIILLF